VGLPYPGASTIRAAAFILLPDGEVTNQWLPGLGAGTPNLGIAPNLRSVSGDQFVEVDLPIDTAGIVEPPDPVHLTLSYANPARSSARIAFTVPETSRVRVSIHDAQGRLVRVLADEVLGAGPYMRTWDGGDDGGRAAPSGIYFITVRAGQESRTGRVVFLR
jgi:hypothetical protein